MGVNKDAVHFFASSWTAFALIVACLLYYFKDEFPELLLPKWCDHDLVCP